MKTDPESAGTASLMRASMPYTTLYAFVTYTDVVSDTVQSKPPPAHSSI